MKFVFGLRNIRQRVTGLYGSTASLFGSYLLPVSRSPDIFRGTSEFAVELRFTMGFSLSGQFRAN